MTETSPRDQWVTRVFLREEAFYLVDLPEDDDLNAHAELNPGTVMITDVEGAILWRRQ